MRALAQQLARRLVPRRIRNWIRRPGPSFLWVRDACLHAAHLDRAVEIRSGWRLRCHPAAYRLAYRAHVDDPEQVSELDAFIAACTPAMVLFDVGAHFGLFSLAALHFGGAAARAVALDPSPAAARMLRVQARLNGVEDRLTVLCAAAAAQDGELELVDAGVGSAGYFVRPERSHGASERTAAPALALDGLVTRLGLRPTHLKIDVEGSEATVLRGSRATLLGDIAPLLFLELHNEMVARGGGDPSESLAILQACGYSVFDLQGHRLEGGAILSRPLIRLMAKRAIV